MDLIKFKNLYRKGYYLFDTQKWVPHYSILEFTWTFCNYPPIANKVADVLERSLPDIPDTDKLSQKDIDWYIYDLTNKYLSLSEEKRLNKPPEFVRLMWMMISAIKKGKLEYVPVFNSTLDVLDSQLWEPAAGFRKLLNKIPLK